jgi:hypothetical protein
MSTSYFYSAASQLNPTLCNQQSLRVLALSLSDANNLFQPLPLFYSESQCSAGVVLNQTMTSDKKQFPSFNDVMDCTSEYPTQPNNCIKVTTSTEMNRYRTVPTNRLSLSQINLTPFDNMTSNMFDSIQRIHSIYVPPGMQVTFFQNDPRNTPYTSNNHITFKSGQLVLDTCFQNLKLSNGTTSFFNFNNSSKQMTSDFWFYQFLSNKSVAETNTNIQAVCDDTNIKHSAPYVVIEIVTSFTQLLRQTCLTNASLFIGDTDMRQFWHPQSSACDQLMTQFCSQNTSDTICACFEQQRKLNRMFSESLEVPVCCFGHLVANSMGDSCSWQPSAYKTNHTLQSCCQHTECERLITNIIGIDETQSNLYCTSVPTELVTMFQDIETKMKEKQTEAEKKYKQDKETFINSPSLLTSSTSTTTSTPQITNTQLSQNYTRIPNYIWIITIVGIGLLLISFLIFFYFSGYQSSSFDPNSIIVRKT